MRLACSIIHYDFVKYPFKKALADIAEIGYEGVETGVPASLLRKDRYALKRLTDALGLEIATLSGGVIGAEPDPQKFQVSMNTFKDAVELAHDFGIDRVVTATGECPEGIDPKRAFATVAERFAVATDFAAARGVKVLVEAVYVWLVKDSATFLELKRLSGSKNLYANIDPSNYLLAGEDPAKAVEKLVSVLGGVHLKDGRVAGSEKLFTPMGEGDVDFKGFLQALARVRYDNWLVVEYEGGNTGRFYSDPEKASRESYEYARQILREIS